MDEKSSVQEPKSVEKGTTFVGFKEDFLARSSGFVVDLRTASNDAFFETRFDLRRILFD